MKRLILCLALTLVFTGAYAQKASIQYQDASAFPVFGKAYSDDGPRYRRLPQNLQGVVREPLWNLGTNSAGLYVRFRTDAPVIYAHWTNTGNHMPHMTDCGTGGLDLYAYLDGEWSYVGSGFNWGPISKDHTRKLVGNMEPQMREYMLNLSLYDEVIGLELGVPEGYTIRQPQLDSPRSDAPIVMYGTSILQGGCASRPGMAHTNILSRRFNRTVINLGFSGNAFLDEEIAYLMAGVEHPAVFVLDNVPNSSPEKIREKGERFFRILREAHPDVPVILVEDPQFSHSTVDQAIAEEIHSKNEAQKELFQKLVAAGEKRIYYLPSEGMVGTDAEAFVDGIHFTDLGMLRYADWITPLLTECLYGGACIRPEYLKEGDKVALISPSYATDMENVEKAALVLQNWGFQPVVGPHVGKVDAGCYAGTVQERLEDLRWALTDPEIKAILCNRGGYGTLHLLDSLSLDEFRSNPKWLVGYSDITSLLALENCAGVQALHATMGASIAKNDIALTSTLMRDFLMGQLPEYQLEAHPQNIPGRAHGMLVGGNLCTLTPLLGTKADITAREGLILYIEEVEESMHNVDRQFKMLENAGVLKRCRGVILGQFTGCGQEFTFDSIEAMLRPYLEPYGIPVLCGFPAGHGSPNMPLMMGAMVTLDVRPDGATLSFD